MSKSIEAVKILELYKTVVWKEMQKYLHDPSYPLLFRVPSQYKVLQNFHWRLVTEYPKRKGKYLRPALILLACEALGGKQTLALKTATAMQISEEWLLIHDDIEDRSWERRGKPTLHRIYQPELAINAGDTLHVIMWKVLIDNKSIMGPAKTYEIMDEFYRILSRTTLGQSVEIKWSTDNKTDFSDNDWFFISDGKTSYYTIAGPMRLGGIIADIDKKKLDTLTRFGLYLGRCFQLVDDILDVTSDFGGLKRQTGNDIYEGKRTIMLGHLLRNAGPDERKRILSILAKGREEKTREEVRWIIQRMHEGGSIKYAQGLAEKLKTSAYKIFKDELSFLSHQPARNKIEALIHFVLERDH